MLRLEQGVLSLCAGTPQLVTEIIYRLAQNKTSCALENEQPGKQSISRTPKGAEESFAHSSQKGNLL